MSLVDKTPGRGSGVVVVFTIILVVARWAPDFSLVSGSRFKGVKLIRFSGDYFLGK